MNKRVLFGLLVTVLFLVTAFNVYAQTVVSDDDLQAKVTQIQEEKQKAKEENQELKQTLEKQKPADIQAHHEALMKRANRFVETAFVQQTETYPERKEEAKDIMSDDLVETFFPTDTYKGDTKTSVQQLQLFVETGTLNKNQATLLFRFNHTIHDKQSGEKQTSPIFLEVDAQRQNGQWIMTSFKEAEKEG